MQQKRDQGTLGTQRSTLFGSRTRFGPSMDPAMALKIHQTESTESAYLLRNPTLWTIPTLPPIFLHSKVTYMSMMLERYPSKRHVERDCQLN